MNRTDYVLAVMAAARLPLTSVELQILFFILDRKAGAQLGGPWFDFEGGGFGPCDQAVFDELQNLSEHGLASIDGPPGHHRYALACAGIGPGVEMMGQLSIPQYVGRIIEYLRSASFTTVLGAIYAECPEMRTSCG